MSENINNEENFEGNNSVATLKSELFDWIQNITFILSTIVIIFIFVFRIVGVDGESMMPTLKHKDWLIISDLFYEPEYGDIVVLSKDAFLDGKMIVKRIIATEGQKIDIDFEKGIVYVDDVALDEPYIAEKTRRQMDMIFPATVPEDSVFVMGDNRNHSSDSRDASLGMVHESNILGRLIIRVFPFSSFGIVD
ncbi:MAG: signal peptidase I [Oscillospiraceae bacterium]|nr:signal peptidase I [Oscillospiraceae bacterium]